MPAPSNFNDYSPLTWFRRTPIYVTTILVALFVAGMFATVFLATARFDWHVFAFSPADLWRHGAVWQLLTYPLLGWPGFFFLFSMFCFYWFGVDVERYLGRSRYFKLLALLLLTPVALLSLWWSKTGVEYEYAGANDLTIGFFVAFATLYPNLEFWGWIPMKWLAFAGIVLSAMNYLPAHDWPGLTVLLASCGAGFGYIRFLQRGGSVELPEAIKTLFKRRPKFKVVPRPSETENLHASIDPLLDKIAKSGLASLTPREREQLQRARETLLKKQG